MLAPNPVHIGKRVRVRVRVRVQEGGGDNNTSRPCPLIIPIAHSAAVTHSIVSVSSRRSTNSWPLGNTLTHAKYSSVPTSDFLRTLTSVMTSSRWHKPLILLFHLLTWWQHQKRCTCTSSSSLYTWRLPVKNGSTYTIVSQRTFWGNFQCQK